MSSGERPMGAAKGNQTNTIGLVAIPPPPHANRRTAAPPEKNKGAP